ncbi:MAG: hypothetical protein DRN78_03450 [Thermoproteota archaeon]|nr:MAG: hypothetical protein DRN78_03450 [Candidatus Korarchaeota archaeon]
MAGLGGAYSAAILILVISIAMMLIYGILVRYPVELLELGVNYLEDHIKEEIKLDLEGNPEISGTSIYVNLTNDGPGTILARDLERIDVIVEYRREGTGALLCEKLPFMEQLDPQSKGWTIDSIFTPQGKGELVNPIDIPYFTKGAWDPGETAAFEINVPLIDASEPISVVISSPSGSKAVIQI